MFSCGTKKKTNAEDPTPFDSPVTPKPPRRTSFNESVVPNRPSTGTPAPWTPRLSVLARVPQVNRNGKEDNTDSIKPVFVSEVPQIVHDEQATSLHKRVPVENCGSGGIDKSTSLAWIICGSKIFIWSYLSPASSMNCVVLDIPLNDGVFFKK